MECFVIMPFGEKEDVNGKTVDFDVINKYLIKDAVEKLGIVCKRCDEIAEPGQIHFKMFQQIYNAQVAIVDITTLNPNVLYELGLRHALTPFVTVIIRRKGTRLPFNIQDVDVVEYDDVDIASVEETKKRIGDFIRNGLKLRKIDSPVHNAIRLRINAEPTNLSKQDIFEYKMRETPDKRICLITGDLENIKNKADIWVSSENTNMQMARHYERSISAVVRFLGAKKDPRTRQIVEDTIAIELSEIVGKNANVAPGTVISTGAGELKKTHGVKVIFHAASVVGQVGPGYTPIPDGKCVWNSLERVDSDELSRLGLTTYLIPIDGHRYGQRKPRRDRGETSELRYFVFRCEPSF